MHLQPPLHELVSCLRAPTTCLSSRDGQIHLRGAQGVYHRDVRVLARGLLQVQGGEPEPVMTVAAGPSRTCFVAVVRGVADRGADPALTLVRERQACGDGLTERISISSGAESPVRLTVTLHLGADDRAMDAIKGGRPPGSSGPTVTGGDGTLGWDADGLAVLATARDAQTDPEKGVMTWMVGLSPGQTAELVWELRITAHDPVVAAATGSPRWARPVVRAGDPRLAEWVDRSLDDLDSLRMVDVARSGSEFLAAGSPWFFTLFGRDSLWAARMMLPLGTDLAASTLRALAGYQGERVVEESGEAPGKILHELRSRPVRVQDGGTPLPLVYYGSVDSTLLWVSLLHDAWRWGMSDALVEELLPAAQRAMQWVRSCADPDDDGFVEYVDRSGTGLANQGWKDSGDSVRFHDGTRAESPIALVEVQGYAYRAARDAAALFRAFGRPGEDEWSSYAERLSEKFRRSFWVDHPDGAYPAMALDRGKAKVDSLTSNIGHLLGTGLLSAQESALVAQRLGARDLDSGFGLRTMSTRDGGFAPLSYHCGSVWPHDTAIVARGLAAEGHTRQASELVLGLLRSAAAFENRLPELWAGFAATELPRPVPYPAACRPQAWAAAAAVSALTTLLGLTPDVPSGVLTVRPLPETGVGSLRVDGLVVGGQRLDVTTHPGGGAPTVVCAAPLRVVTEG
ncbi:MAG: amylo-alpha-1,6-glucosidase [Actinomycetes bacterium]